ncbi:hypothetical protein [Nocardia panacis]|nr:hypothetical protein [Nocardia panacis]
MGTPLEQIDTETLAARAAVLADLAKFVGEQRDLHKAELSKRMPRGSKITGRHPADDTLSLGTVTMSDPRAEAYIVDRDAFEKWCRSTYPSRIEVWPEFGPAEEVAAVLAEHAPHLVTIHSSVPGPVKEQALDRAESEDVPGTERRLPTPVLSVRATTNARAVVRAMVSASSVLRELEA